MSHAVTRLDRLRQMRAFIDAEIEAELLPAARSAVHEAAVLYGVIPADVLGGSRKLQVCRARQAAAWLLRQSGLSYPEIGRTLGIDHTTALYACRKIDASPSVRALLLGLAVA